MKAVESDGAYAELKKCRNRFLRIARVHGLPCLLKQLVRLFIHASVRFSQRGIGIGADIVEDDIGYVIKPWFEILDEVNGEEMLNGKFPIECVGNSNCRYKNTEGCKSSNKMYG